MALPAKILLKGTSKISLNERFSRLPAPAATANVRSAAAAETLASAKNRRLAMQMENRPSVRAALGGQVASQTVRPTAPLTLSQWQRARVNTQTTMPTERSSQQLPLSQRIGRPNVKARLALPVTVSPGRNLQWRGRGFGNQFRGRGQFSGVVRGVPRGRGMQQRGRGFMSRRGQGNRGRGRGGGAFRARGRGMGRGGRGRGNAVSVEQLDNQLEEYMSKTKSHLDSELDAYMTQVQN